MNNEPKALYVKVGNNYYLMKKVEYDSNDIHNAQGWAAKYNDETGELFWEEI